MRRSQADRWATHLAAARQFHAREGHLRVARKHVEELAGLFLHREGRIPAARETVRVDGDTVKLGAWLAKARTKHRAGGLPDEHVSLVAALFDGDWTADNAAPAALL